jgi:hypothetical protein
MCAHLVKGINDVCALRLKSILGLLQPLWWNRALAFELAIPGHAACAV